MMPENIKAIRRFPMKSKLVFPRISNMLTPFLRYWHLAVGVMLDAQLLDLLPLVHKIEDDLGPDQSGEQINRNSEAQCDGTTFDRARPEEKQGHAGNEGRDV